MSRFQCTILSDETPIKFGKEELHKYGEEVHQPIPFSFILGVEQEFIHRGLIKHPVLQADPSIDAFHVVDKESEIYIIGSNARSVLFGVYHACKKLFGYKWVSFLSKESLGFSDYQFDTDAVHSGKMKRRGLVVENYDDTTFLLQLIDWAAKQYINEMFFTFMLWDKVKHIVAEEIEKRGLSITIGGHSMHYLLKEASSSEKQQIDFADDSWKDAMITKIKDYCEETASIKRLSLWPADIGINDNNNFLSRYMEFTEQLQAELPTIKVEHIAYNAGLSWDMLELPEEVDSSKSVNTLFAYWGRNYNQSFTKEKRAYEALQKWSNSTKTNQKQLTIFEYYSDHFMLGDMFPPLFHRIHEDIEMYAQMGIERIVNLIVPYIPKENGIELDYKFPWQSLQLMNSYYFARLAWGDDFADCEEDFYSIFEEQQEEVKKALRKVEIALSEISKWNVPLFPSRLIDPEKVEEYKDLQLILNDIKRWKREIEPLKLSVVKEIDDPTSMIAFYIYYLYEKMEDYYCKWNIKSVQ